MRWHGLSSCVVGGGSDKLPWRYGGGDDVRHTSPRAGASCTKSPWPQEKATGVPDPFLPLGTPAEAFMGLLLWSLQTSMRSAKAVGEEANPRTLAAPTSISGC